MNVVELKKKKVRILLALMIHVTFHLAQLWKLAKYGKKLLKSISKWLTSVDN